MAPELRIFKYLGAQGEEMAKATGGTKKKASKKQTAKKAAAKASPKKSTTKKAATKKASRAAKAPVKQNAATQAADKTASPPASVLDAAHLPATSGKVGVFGGPKDRGYKPDDKLALPTGPHSAFERVRTLNPKSYYCMMRWDYHIEHMSPEEGKRWWANKKLLVTSPKSGQSVVVRAVDFGPHENTGLAISVSPGALESLGVEVGDEVEIAFADQKAPLGPVT